MKKFFYVILLAACYGTVAIANTSDEDVLFTENGLEYSYILPSPFDMNPEPIDSSIVMVCGYEKPDDFDSKQPLRILGSVIHNGRTYQVKEIKRGALEGILSVKEIVVEEGIERIGDNAFFGCYYLESIFLPASVRRVGTNLLLGCNNLKKIVVDPENKFYDSRDNCNAIIDTKRNSLEEVCPSTTIPSSVKEIGTSAFAGFTNLEKFVVPEGIEVIGLDAFAFCSNLKEIKLPESLRVIWTDAFRNCTSLESIFIPKNVYKLGSNPFAGCYSLTSIVVDKENKYLDSRSGCNGIIFTKDSALIVACKTTRLVESIKDIGSPFKGVAVHSIRIPKSVEHIHGDNLLDCTEVDTLTVAPDNPKYISPDGSNAILTKDGKELVLGCRTTKIPAGVEEIGFGAFSGRCTDIVLTLPEGIKTIYDAAFANNKSICMVTIPATITEIGNSAFCNCENLQAVQFLRPIEEIAPHTFNGCKNLTTINIPEGVKSIGSKAFAWCTKLKNVHLPSTLEVIEEDAFKDCPCEESVKRFLENKK